MAIHTYTASTKDCHWHTFVLPPSQSNCQTDSDFEEGSVCREQWSSCWIQSPNSITQLILIQYTIPQVMPFIAKLQCAGVCVNLSARKPPRETIQCTRCNNNQVQLCVSSSIMLAHRKWLFTPVLLQSWQGVPKGITTCLLWRRNWLHYSRLLPSLLNDSKSVTVTSKTLCSRPNDKRHPTPSCSPCHTTSLLAQGSRRVWGLWGWSPPRF